MKDFTLFFEQALKSKCEIKNYLLPNYFVANVMPIFTLKIQQLYRCVDLTTAYKIIFKSFLSLSLSHLTKKFFQDYFKQHCNEKIVYIYG